MICRIWRGRTTATNAAAYETILRNQVMPEIVGRKIDGFLGYELMKRPYDEGYEFTTIMWFEGLDAVKRFLGEDYESAHVPQKAREMLCWFDARSKHYEVFEGRRFD